MDGWNTTFLLGRPIFRGENVSFRECTEKKGRQEEVWEMTSEDPWFILNQQRYWNCWTVWTLEEKHDPMFVWELSFHGF